jgi:uncharacterized surface protein with fasciclin (FAS1) repeats
MLNPTGERERKGSHGVFAASSSSKHQEISMPSLHIGLRRSFRHIVSATALSIAMVGGSYAEGTGADIVDTAIGAGQFTTLAKALQAAGLVETLKGSGPFTVFAPTDAAFAKLPAGTVESLLKPENKEKLKGILTYHVVPGSVKAAQVVTMTSAKTVNGDTVAFKAQNNAVKVDQANVVKADIVASNGVIHVVDAVLMPN